MPSLNEVFGHLLSEITTARFRADIEAMHIAELYAGHPLLKHMPVPRFRLPEVTIDVPLAIKEIATDGGTAPARDVVINEMLESFSTGATAHLKDAGVRLTETERKQLESTLNAAADQLRIPSATPVSITNVGTTFVRTMYTAMQTIRQSREKSQAGRRKTASASADLLRIKEALSDDRLSTMTAALERQALSKATLKIQAEPARIGVLATTAEVREAGPKEVLATFHLSIKEDAFEWAVSEDNGVMERRLTPE